MIVLSRERGESIKVGGKWDECLITVLQVRGHNVSLLINYISSITPGKLETIDQTLAIGGHVQAGEIAKVTVVDIRDQKARLGIEAPKEMAVHRLEVWEAIKRETRRGDSGDDADDGLAGSRVPRPAKPKPPTLDVRLNEPPPSDDAN